MHKEISYCVNKRNPSLLEYLYIESCDSLTSLWSKSELPAALEYIELWNCEKLVSLSSSENLPEALKCLNIYCCSRLESIAERLQNHTSLERIMISWCNNIKVLPYNLHKVCHLQEITIQGCPSFVSFPEEGLPSMNLRKLEISNCEELGALPNRIHNLTSLKDISIGWCPSMISFPVNGFPTSLASLCIEDAKFCKPLFDWGLHRLSSLTDLTIDGGCPDVVSFPLEEIGMMLPTSLTCLRISNFPNLECISYDIRNLTSLEKLSLYNCYKLKSFPEEGLPSSLLQLKITRCPILKQRCKKYEGRYWPIISHIPYIQIDIHIHGDVYNYNGPKRQQEGRRSLSNFSIRSC
ncbi:putative disease resistance protein At3g14460 [Pistacia vera]|uniref:putative disease resistance protein At3g14460 n=1 Tax=Pistacia vera TaxID=55513 RepID=UPI001263D714|nr:putative disease resistance protein At3g14460 [Pistacia vera]